MEIVDFWKRQVDKWQTENKCGFCWEFGAPLKDSQLNIEQTDEACCTYVFLTEIETVETPKFSPNTGFLNGKNCDTTFTLYVVRKGDLGTNNYSEIKGHPISESNWETIFNPISECLDCNLILDFCTLEYGLKIDITQWRKTLEHAAFDNNYFGWKVRGTFRISQ